MAVGAVVKLAGKLLKAAGGAKGLKGIAGEAAASGALNTLGGIAFGMDPLEALAYGGADTLASAASLGLVRGLRPKGYQFVRRKGPDGKEIEIKERIRSRAELPANILASVASGMGVAALMGEGSSQGVDGSQQAQVLQQQQQRAAINQDPSLLAGAYFPYTNFQNTGIPSARARLQQSLQDSGPMFDMAAAERNMQQILGL